MPIKKFKSFEDAERDLWVFQPDERYYKRLRAFYNFAAKFQVGRFPRAIFKFRSIQEAKSQKTEVRGQKSEARFLCPAVSQAGFGGIRSQGPPTSDL
jgi:hypothetical protein